MGVERRIHRSLEEGTLLSEVEHTKPVWPKDIILGKHFLLEQGKTIEIFEKVSQGSDETKIRVDDKEHPWRILPNDEQIGLYEHP